MHSNSLRGQRPYPLKTPREQLVDFTIETHICPQVTLRVLALLTQQSVEYVTLNIDHQKHGIVIQFIIEALEHSRLEKLQTKIEAIVMVREVKVTKGLTLASANMQFPKVG